MKINYFQKGGGAEEIARLYQQSLILNNVADKLNAAGFKTESTRLPITSPQPAQTSTDRLSDELVARMIIGQKGEWAVNGQARKDLLAQKGYDYATVQGIINKLMKPAASTQKPTATSTPINGQQTGNSTSPILVPHYTDLPYVAMIQARNGQNPTGMIDNATATLLKSNNIANESARQNRIAREENLERLWDLYEDNHYKDALSNPNNYYGVAIADPNRAKTVRHDIHELYHNGYGIYNPAYALKRNALDLSVPSRKQGGQINYFQQGGQVDPVTAVIQSLILNPQETYAKLEQLMQRGQQKQVNAILGEIKNRATNGDPQAQAAIQALQQVIQGQQTQAAPQQAQIAEKGAKLNYFRKLKGLCPEGEEIVYMKKGGCPVCQKKKEEAKKENKKQYFGKDKKVAKAEPGDKLPNPKPKSTSESSDSITATQRRSKSGNEVGTEKRDNGLTTIMAQGPALGGTYYGLFFNGDSIVNKTGILSGAVYPASEEERKRFINFVNGSDSIPVMYKERVPESSAMFPILSQKTGGKTQFFKKGKKAPIAKCGCKSKKK